MKSFTLQKKEVDLLNGGYKVSSMTLAQLYRELNGLGHEVVDEMTAEASRIAQAAIEGAGNREVATPSGEGL
jgi:hypothetical protein